MGGVELNFLMGDINQVNRVKMDIYYAEATLSTKHQAGNTGDNIPL